MSDRKTDARVRYTKMMIKQSFIALVKEKPISKITVTELCTGAGINRATFYAHYSDPFDLLGQIENEVMDDVLEELAGSLTTADANMQDVLARVFQYVLDNSGICEVLLSDSVDSGFMAQVVKMLELQFLLQWEGSDSKEDAEYLYTFAAIGGVGLIRKWLSDGMKKSPAQMAELTMKLANSGYSAFR